MISLNIQQRRCYKPTYTYQVHLQSNGKGGAVGGKPSAPAAASVKGGKGTTGPGVGTPALDEEGALRIIQAVITGKPDLAVAEQQLKDAVSKVII